jgi:hypothetical protein
MGPGTTGGPCHFPGLFIQRGKVLRASKALLRSVQEFLHWHRFLVFWDFP